MPQKCDQHPLPGPSEFPLGTGSLPGALLSAAKSSEELRKKVLEKNCHHPAPYPYPHPIKLKV